jgi:hypothetical protein
VGEGKRMVETKEREVGREVPRCATGEGSESPRALGELVMRERAGDQPGEACSLFEATTQPSPGPRKHADWIRAEILIVVGPPVNTSKRPPSKKRLGGSPSAGWRCSTARRTWCGSRGVGMSPVPPAGF